jgi:hypothetical protein
LIWYLKERHEYLLGHDNIYTITWKSLQKPSEIYPAEKDCYSTSLRLHVAFDVVWKKSENANIHDQAKISGHLTEILQLSMNQL